MYIRKIPKYVIKCNSSIVNNSLIHHIHLLLGAFDYFIDLEVACQIIYAIKTLFAIGVFFGLLFLFVLALGSLSLPWWPLGIGLLPLCLWFLKTLMVLASFIILVNNFSFFCLEKDVHHLHLMHPSSFQHLCCLF